VGPRVGMDDMGKWKLLTLPGTELPRTDERGGGCIWICDT
jgi:hypothetical protein